MDIEIIHLLEGSDQAGGLAVVIDVFRAFSLTKGAWHHKKSINEFTDS